MPSRSGGRDAGRAARYIRGKGSAAVVVKAVCATHGRPSAARASSVSNTDLSMVSRGHTPAFF